MKRTILILLALLLLAPAALRAQDGNALYTGWGAGFHIGVGGMLPTGSLADGLKGCAVFTGGVDVEFQRARLKLDVSFAQPSFKIDNPYAVVDSQGRNLQQNGTASTTLFGGDIQLGYTVWRHGKVSITPCVGVNFNRLKWDMNTIKWEADDEGKERPQIDNVTDVHENATGFIASVDFDIVLGGKFVDLGGNSHYTSSLRITPFFTHAGYGNLSPAIKGNWIGVTVNYAGLSRLLSSN